MKAVKPWWASKIIWLGVLELTVGILALLVGSELTTGFLKSVLLITAGVLTVILRFLTDRPIGLTQNESCSSESPE